MQLQWISTTHFRSFFLHFFRIIRFFVKRVIDRRLEVFNFFRSPMTIASILFCSHRHWLMFWILCGRISFYNDDTLIKYNTCERLDKSMTHLFLSKTRRKVQLQITVTRFLWQRLKNNLKLIFKLSFLCVFIDEFANPIWDRQFSPVFEISLIFFFKLVSFVDSTIVNKMDELIFKCLCASTLF